MIEAVPERTHAGAPVVSLLGPQRLRETVGDVADSLDLDRQARVATITAGWQERESEDSALDERLARPTVNLRLYERALRAFARDRELSDAHHAVQENLKELRRLYNVRLAAAMDAVFSLLLEAGDSAILERERQAAIDSLRDLDDWHLGCIDEERSTFNDAWRPLERPAIAAEREEIARDLAGVAAVAVSGGHVAVLVNRLRLFGLDELLRAKTILAWSAGAMALSERVVLFHDSPPWGPGNAEVFERGLALYPGVVALPHGRRRLQLSDAIRVARFARRFAPAQCVILEPGSRIDWDGGGWTAPKGAWRLTEAGGLDEVEQWS